ncbi:hypothetical protein CICLE_v10010041mg [Citrus x clementina]|uniref:Uncharacterized protein n=1 Tax=Citrus clementina TaxID=85681 RepID=V4WEF4_CITCL|nr:hypothetical protein CICLE_v10010041mg [Citrus x clementina]
MGSCKIPSQLKKFLFLVSNETECDEIYQSHSHPVYANEIKKNVSLAFLNFFYKTKICLNPFLNGTGSRRIPSHWEKLSSLEWTEVQHQV